MHHVNDPEGEQCNEQTYKGGSTYDDQQDSNKFTDDFKEEHNDIA